MYPCQIESKTHHETVHFAINHSLFWSDALLEKIIHFRRTSTLIPDDLNIPMARNMIKAFSELFSAGLEYFGREDDEWEDKGFPVIPSTKDDLKALKQSMIWVGQSTIFLNYNDITILTDPHFGDRASPFSFIGPKRITPPPFSVNDLPAIDLVLISHDHYDHLDEGTIKALAKEVLEITYFVPLGLAETLTSWGAQNVIELD